MKVNFIIVHELKKLQHVQGAELISSNTVMPLNQSSIALITELNKRFQGQNSFNAQFGDAGKVFPSKFLLYRNYRNEDTFIDFTTSVCDDLRSRIELSAPAKGGYLVFADYEEYGSFVAVFLIRNKDGMLFVRSDNGYVLANNIQHIDFESMAMACRINCGVLSKLDSDERYLRFTKRDSEDISAYFREWITVKDTESMKENTRNLYQALKEIPKRLDSEGNELSEDELMVKAVTYIKDNRKRVNLRLLSLYLYADDNVIRDYAHENNLALDSEFVADSRMLNRYTLVKAKAGDLELKFPRRYYNNKVSIHPNKDIITINSHDLAEEIRKIVGTNEI